MGRRFPTNLIDILLGGLQCYRRWRGGRWELVVESGVPGTAYRLVYWARVVLPTPGPTEPWWERTAAREDWRR